MNHAHRNRNKVRLNKGQRKQKAKRAHVLLQLELKEANRQLSQMRYEVEYLKRQIKQQREATWQKINETKPPAGIPLWTQVFNLCFDQILDRGVHGRALITRDEGGHIAVYEVPVADILFGAASEIERLVIPADAARLIYRIVRQEAIKSGMMSVDNGTVYGFDLHAWFSSMCETEIEIRKRR